MKNLFWIVCTAILLVSCQEDETGRTKQYPQEKVNMNFTFHAARFTTNAETRAVETLPIESVMKDLVVMQFNGTGDDAALIGTPQYFPEYDAEPASMSFIASNGDTHTVYFVANTNRDLGMEMAGKTLGDFKRMVYDIPTEIQLVEGQGLLMTGSWTGVVSNDADVKEVLLTRAMAKVAFHLIKNLPSESTVRSVSVENVPSSVAYVESFDNAAASQIIYPTKTYDGETEYTWYVPENLNTTKEKSTCVVITVAVSGSTMVYPCRVYFNQTEDTPDYTLKRNHSYDLSVTLTGTSSTEGEYLVDCHYERIDISTATGAVITSDANWIDVSNSATWVAGLTQTVTATSSTVYLHVDDNLTDADRTATVTVTEGTNTKTYPIKQKAIQKVGWFGAPDADGVYTGMLGMEMIEENTYRKWYTDGRGFSAVFPDTDKYKTYTGKELTERYGTNSLFEAFYYCYEKNKDKTNIKWYLPSQAQLLALLVGQKLYQLRTSGSGYYSATMSFQAVPINYGFEYFGTVLRGVDESRFVRCVRDL